RSRATAAGASILTIGTLADSVEQAGAALAAAFRERHPDVEVRIHETDFTDPTAGVRSGRADIALTRMPFDRSAMTVRVLRSDPIGVVLRADDPLARRPSLALADLAERRWFRLPDDTDAPWRAYWMPSGVRADGPVVRTIHECVQAALWNDTVGLTALGHELPHGLTAVPLRDHPP
ncbi:substrate-binding domain-containing protein, partial [Nocardia gipuzkoensis]